MTIVELEQQGDARRVEAKALHEVGESSGAWTDEQESKFASLMDEADESQKRITATAKRESRLASLQASSVESLGRETEPNPPGTQHVKVGKDRIEDDPNQGLKTPHVILSAVMALGHARIPAAR